MPSAPVASSRKASGVSIAALIVGILSIALFIFGPIALILGIIGLNKSRKYGAGGYGMSLAGTIMGAITSVLLLLALMAIPNFRSIKRRAHDVGAQTAGRQAKLAEEMYYNDHLDDYSGRYTSSLSDLLVYDRNIADDKGMTLVWGYADDTSFEYATTHKNGSCNKTFVFTD